MASAGVSTAGVTAPDSCAGVTAPDSCAERAAPDSCAAVEVLDSRAGVWAPGGRRSVTVTPRSYLPGEMPRACHTVTDPSVRVSRCDTSGAGVRPGPASGQTAAVDVLVTGATGSLGQQLVPHLTGAGHSVRQMSRRGAGPGGVRGDLATGSGLPAAAAGAELVVHAASDPRGDVWQADVAGTRRLVQALDRERLRHLVFVSIVGVDRIPYGYYHAKFAAEQVLLASGLPVTLVRITQFHTFVDQLLATARRGPVLPVPMGWRVQPVDVGEAAAHVAEVAGQPPAGDVVEFGGPEELVVADIARAWAAAREPGAHVVATPVPGRLSAAFREGAALPTSGARGRR